MKRGLKVETPNEQLVQYESYNHYPDEKGTERRLRKNTDSRHAPVTTTTPMKRGLKERNPQKNASEIN